MKFKNLREKQSPDFGLPLDIEKKLEKITRFEREPGL